MKKTFLFSALSVLCLCAQAQEKTERLDSVIVSASRAGKNTPVTYDNVGKDALERSNPMNSLPQTLGLLPSVVTTSEGGTGLGSTAMTIRGSKGSQINVTLNGITLNDAESQEVFWLNIPSLASMLSSVQVQRGLGTSASGSGAFGASINMNTAFVTPDPWADVSFSAGSYNTFITTLAASTGRTRKGLYASAAFTQNTTNGYIRNAFVQAQSAFAVLGWLGRRNSLRLTYLMGKQRSGITWDGIDLDQYAKDRTYNGAGEYYDELGNVYYYDNQTDNYAQHHVQLQYTHAFTDALTLSATANYTRGDGYDEYYKVNKKLKNYGLPTDQGVSRSDMTYQKKMDNNLWTVQSTLRYRMDRLDINGGVNLSHYSGGHWGEILWVKALSGDFPKDNWYNNIGVKKEASAFVRAEYRPLEWLTAYTELQYRTIHYTMEGPDDDWLEYGAAPEDVMNYRQVWNFFNPRAGVTAAFDAHKIYVSAAIGHREPGRSDIKENIKGEGTPIKPEAMLDLELGYRYEGPRFQASANLYAMEYKDMLLETGKLSTAGYAIKENVSRAWRRGVELEAAWQPLRWMRADGNLTLSMNQIADYTSYVPYDDYSGTVPINYGKTTMLMSPSTIGMLQLTFMPLTDFSISMDGKYVGKQYLDNSMREEMAVPEYFVMNANIQKTFRLGPGKMSLGLYVHNLLNHMYYASGWRWESISKDDGTLYSGVGVYPQAPRNYMLKIRFTF